MAEGDDEFRGVQWTIENFSYWNGEVHHGKVLCSRSFLCGGFHHTLELYPRGTNGDGEHLEVKLGEKIFKQCARSFPPFSGHLSFIASDGSLVCSQSIAMSGFHLYLCSSGPKFREVVARNRKNESEHQDRLTLRLQLHDYDATIIYMRTIIDVHDVSVNISPEGYKELESEKFTEISNISFPFRNTDWRRLSLQVEKCKILAIVSEHDLDPTLVMIRTSVLDIRDGSVVRTDEKEHLFHKMRRFEFPSPLTREEVDKKGFSLLLRVKIVPGNDFRQCCFGFTRKIGVDVTSTQVLNQDSSATSKESSVDDSNDVVSREFDKSVKELANDFMCLYQDQDFSDIELQCGDVSFPVHKNILSARSPVFKTMLSTDMKEAASSEVDIEDMDPSTLSHFLTYLYTGDVNELQGESALKLYYAADKYQVPSLKRECSDILCDNVTMSNVCDILSLADQHQDCNLTSAAHTFFLENFNEVLASEEWKSFMKNEPLLAVETVTHFGEKKFVGKMTT